MKPYLAALLACVVLAGCSKEAEVNFNEAPAVAETAIEREEAVRDAFKEPPTETAASKAVVADVQVLFTELTQAGQAYDATRVLKLVSVDHLLSMALENTALKLSPAERSEALRSSTLNVRRSWFQRGDGTFDWAESTVMRVQVSDDGTFALAYVRHLMDDYGTLDKARWWLVRKDNTWLVYDWEYVTTGIRTSRQWGRTITAASGLIVPPWIKARDYIGEARVKMRKGEYEASLKELEAADGIGYPPDIEGVRLQYVSLCLSELGQYTEALDYARRSLRLRPDFPEARLSRGSALYGLERYEEALVDVRWYIETLGSDPVAYWTVGNCLLMLDRRDEARDAYLASLRDIPLGAAIVGLARCLDDAECEQLGEWFGKLKHPEEDYKPLIEELHYGHDSNAAATAINEAYRKINPDDPDLAWYSAMIAIDEGKHSAAADTLRPAIALAPKDETELFQNTYWESMVKSGRGPEALKEADRALHAFEKLARITLDQWDGIGLNELCEAWRNDHESKHQLHFYLGEADFILEDNAEAEKHFRTGYGLANSGDDLFEALWHGLADCMQAEGKVMEAYTELKGSAEVFQFLADKLVLGEKPDKLAELLQAHGAKNVNVKAWYMPRYKGELAWLQKDWKTAAKYFETYFRSRQAKESPWFVLSHSVRASLRDKDFATAIRRAKTGLEEADNYLLIICYAAWDKPKEAMEALDAYIVDDGDEAASYWVGELYNDEDAGEKFRQPVYEPMQKRFPIPEPEADPEKTPEAEPEGRNRKRTG